MFQLSVMAFLRGDGCLTCSVAALIFSLISLASISPCMKSSKESISQTSWDVFLATCTRISAGSLAMIIGMSRLPYCSEFTPTASSPLMLTFILSHRKQSWLGLSNVQMFSF